MVSGVYLVLIALACLIGPSFTGHQFTTIYQNYVRVPPSLSPYPKPDMIAAGGRGGSQARAPRTGRLEGGGRPRNCHGDLRQADR